MGRSHEHALPSLPSQNTPLLTVMTWNMAEGVGSREKIKATFQQIKRSADGNAAIVALQEAHLPEGSEAFKTYVAREFPEWTAIHFSHPAIRSTHGHTILLSPELSSRSEGGTVLPAAPEFFDLLVEERHKGKRRAVQIAAVDFPPQDGRELTVVIANAHLDVRGGAKHKAKQVTAVSEAVVHTHAAVLAQKHPQAQHDIFILVTGDFNSGRRMHGKRHQERMENISRGLGEELIEVTRRGTTARLLRSIELFFASTQSPWLQKVFHADSPVRRGLRHIELQVPEMGKRSLDHIFASRDLSPGEWFTIDEGASDHNVVGVSLFRIGQ